MWGTEFKLRPLYPSAADGYDCLSKHVRDVEVKSTALDEVVTSGVLHYTHSNGTCRTGLLTACEQDPARKLSANLYDIYHYCVYCEKIPDDGQRNCLKHVEFHSKNKFEKLVHLVGFIIRIYHDAHSPERQILS